MTTKLDKLAFTFWNNMLKVYPNNTQFEGLNKLSIDTLKESIELVLKESKELEEQELMEEWERNSHDKELWGLNKNMKEVV